MKKLIQGLMQYRREELPKRRQMFKRLAEEGQDPDTLFLACADSRIVPNLLTMGEPGELFTVRTVGNLIAPAGEGGMGLGDVSEAAAVEYSLIVLDVRDVVICGHSHCGAMKTVLDGGKDLEGAPNLAEWLKHGVPSIERVKNARFIDHSLALVEQLSQVNVLQQLDHLRTYDFVREREERGDVHLHGWWFDVATGETWVYDEERGGFVTLDDEEAERELTHAGKAPRLTLPPMPY